jgi:hypothetical protein
MGSWLYFVQRVLKTNYEFWITLANFSENRGLFARLYLSSFLFRMMGRLWFPGRFKANPNLMR